jgi:hypothetical protein
LLLRISRYALLASIVVNAAALLLGLLKIASIFELLFLVAIASMIGIVVSSIACIFLQIIAAIRRS